MSNTVLILQSFGLGDIVFCQAIAQHFLSEERKVLWPVEDVYCDGLKRAYPDTNFCKKSTMNPQYFDIREKKLIDGYEIAPIRFSDTFMKVPYADVMISKYAMYKLGWWTWRDHAKWNRSKEREHELMNIVGADLAEPYILVNHNFQTAAKRQAHFDFDPKGIRTIEMKLIDGFSLFDWAIVMENAYEIHTVSTASLYLMELLDIKCPIHLYRRPTEKDFSFVSFLFTKPYMLHL